MWSGSTAQKERLAHPCYRPAAATSSRSYLVVALVLAEMLLPLAVRGKDLGTYRAFLLPIAVCVHFAPRRICIESKRGQKASSRWQQATGNATNLREDPDSAPGRASKHILKGLSFPY